MAVSSRKYPARSRLALVPLFELRGRALLSGEFEKLPLRLGEVERRVLTGASQEQTLQELGGRSSPAARCIPELVDAGLCVILPAPRDVQSKERAVVLSPHSDDAALSVGGILASLANRASITLLTMVGRHGPKKAVGGAEYLSDLRRREDRLYGRLIGASNVSGGLVDAPLRSRQSILSAPNAATVAMFRTVMVRALRPLLPATLYCPLGVGGHVDHLATRDAALSAVRNGQLDMAGSKLFFYEDLPYSLQLYAELFVRLSEVRAAGVRLRPKVVDIGRNLGDKIMGTAIYRSQFPPDPIAREVTSYARLCGSEAGLFGFYKERVWQAVTGAAG